MPPIDGDGVHVAQETVGLIDRRALYYWLVCHRVLFLLPESAFWIV
jgi:hypothetical protein